MTNENKTRLDRVKWIGGYVGEYVIIAILVAVGLRVLSFAVLALLPKDVRATLTMKVRGALGFAEYLDETVVSDEVRAASRDYSSVVLWVTQNLQSEERHKMPDSLKRLLGEPMPFDFVRTTVYPPEDEAVVSPLYIQVAHLSSSIQDKRIAIDEGLSKSYRLAQVGAISSILIGLITTVLVALSSTEIGKRQSHTALTIRTTALVFPALGTATAAIIAFYDPNGSLARQTQVAAGLQQLHSQMAASVWSFRRLGKDDPVPAEVASRLDSWSLRFQELVANLGDSRATPDAQRKAESPTKGESPMKSESPTKSESPSKSEPPTKTRSP